MALPDGAASIFAVATRISQLDSNGYVDPGVPTYTSSALVKSAFTPVMQTGVDVFEINAAGDRGAQGRHDDMIKYYTVAPELVTPDPALEQLLAGGTLLGSTATALGEPSFTVAGQETLGKLAAGTFGYRASQVNMFGESLAAADKSVTISGGTTDCVVVTPTLAAGAAFARVYGRTIGSELLLGTVPNIGKQKASAILAKAVKSKTATNIGVTALTHSIPAGTQFTISGDSNSPKLIFKTLAFAPEGAVTLRVETEQENTAEITTAEIIPVFVDTGAVTPNGNLPHEDQTAGPGEATGYAAPELGIVGNPNGVSLEFWTKAYVAGSQASDLPYYWWVFPKVKGLHQGAKDIAAANTQTTFEGQAYGNPNWSAGPEATWEFSSSRVFQRARCGAAVVPTISLSQTLAVA
jgi:hypothetical protein